MTAATIILVTGTMFALVFGIFYLVNRMKP